MIDKKKLIDEFKALSDDCNLFSWKNPQKIREGILNIINRQPEISEWIPCSKKMPDEPQNVIDDYETAIMNGEIKEYTVTIAGAEESTYLYYTGDGDWYDEVTGEDYFDVVAWQPLPEPYKEGGEWVKAN